MIDIIINIIVLIAGILIGNWLAIGRDKRKEFNQIADKVHLALKRESENLRSNGPKYNGPTNDQLELLKRRTVFYKKKGLNNAIKNYKETKSENWETNGFGDVTIKNPILIKKSILALKNYVKPKK